MKKFRYQPFIAPRYWHTWLAIGCLWLLSRFPYRWQLAIGRRVGVLAAFLLPSRRKIAHTNLTFAFPDLTASDRKALAKRSYEHIGMGIAEAATVWFRPLPWYKHYFDVQGLEQVEEARSHGKGVILLQAHFTLMEAAAAVVGTMLDLSIVTDRPKNELFAELLKFNRERHITEAIENHNIRRMIRRLRNNETVWYSPDLFVAKASGGILTRYFNTPALTTDGIARIVKMTGATIVPFIPTRLNDQGYSRLLFLPALKDFDANNAAHATQQMNDLFEQQIRTQPEQYFWVHKRFKPPSADSRDPYK